MTTLSKKGFVNSNNTTELSDILATITAIKGDPDNLTNADPAFLTKWQNATRLLGEYMSNSTPQSFFVTDTATDRAALITALT